MVGAGVVSYMTKSGARAAWDVFMAGNRGYINMTRARAGAARTRLRAAGSASDITLAGACAAADIRKVVP